MTRIAVLGTGLMGAPMARNLARAGHDVTAWNRSPQKAAALADDGVQAAESPAAAAAEAEVLLTMLADAGAVLEVAGAADPREGTIWWQGSTIGLEGTERAAELARARGVTFVDAPVLGTRAPAEQGALVVLASGPGDALAACAPLFAAVGARTMTIGAAGQATRLKLTVNAWVLAVTEGTAETIALAEALGLDPALVGEALEGGPLDLPYFHMKAAMMARDEFPTSFALALAAKDARLAAEAAEANGADLPLVRAVRDRMREAVDAGLGDEDMAVVYRLGRGGR